MIQKNRALIATHHLIDFAGSEVFTLELATTLISMGWEVTVAAMLVGEPMGWEFRSRSIPVLDLLEAQLPIDGQQFDLVWIHHLPVFHEIVLSRKITGERLVYCSLSPFEPLEAVPVICGSINLLLANSRENADYILKRLGLPEAAVTVFPNSVPQIFWRTQKENHPLQPAKIALISNHPPEEIIDLVAHLGKSGKEIRHIGLQGEPTLVTPDVLTDYDAVISIGKTIPYCFALKIPVYCYDHFGGPGWLHDDNFDLAYRNNFSGRGFQKKDSDVLLHEFETGYLDALASLDKHHAFADAHLHLETNLNQILSREPSPLPLPTVSTNQECMSQHACYRRSANLQKNSANRAKINSLYAEIRSLDAEIQRLKSTFSWQVTKPLRLFAGLVRSPQTVLTELRERSRVTFRADDYSALIPFGYPAVEWQSVPSLAVICHIFYVDMVDEFARYFSNIPFQFDLYITTDTQEKRERLEKFFSHWKGKIEVRIAPNRGRDIAPKLITCRDVYDHHEYILHIHTKKSPHHGRLSGWRFYLLETLIGSTEVVKSVFEAFRSSPDLGIIAPQHFEAIHKTAGWGRNFKIAQTLAHRMGIQISRNMPVDFPSGSMFWARSAAIKPLLDCNLAFDEFPEETGQLDKTLGHAIERLYFFSCERAGYRWMKISRLHLLGNPASGKLIASQDALTNFIGDFQPRQLISKEPRHSRAGGNPGS